MQAAGRVHFDFTGSLQLARRLWSFADEIEQHESNRVAAQDVAAARFLGPKADEFADRRAIEVTSCQNIVASLRDNARAWADAWATALDQQNKNNRQARIEQIRADRGFWERNIGDRILGDDSDEQVPFPRPVSVPTPPGFWPTDSEQTF